MKTKTLFLLLFLFFMHSLRAQKKSGNHRMNFGSQNYIGILEGEAGTSFQLQTINGFRYKTWFAGVGTGLDYYYQRSIPLFISLSKFLPSAKTPFYFNGDAGINFPWNKNGIYDFQYRGDSSPSLYWAGGFGYKFSFKKGDQGILLNLGYSYKHIIQETETSYPCLIAPCPVFTERYDYRLKRLSLKAGWMF